MPKTRRYIFSAVIVIFISLVFYNFNYSTQKKRLQTLSKEKEKVEKLLESSRNYLRKYKSIKIAYDSLSTLWELYQTYLPDEEEMPSLLRAIADAGRRSGADFILFKPLSIVIRDFYTENPIQIKVECGYHEFGKFLSFIAALERLVNIEKIKLKGTKTGSSIEEGKFMEAEFVATAYVSTERKAPAPTTTKK